MIVKRSKLGFITLAIPRKKTASCARRWSGTAAWIERHGEHTPVEVPEDVERSPGWRRWQNTRSPEQPLDLLLSSDVKISTDLPASCAIPRKILRALSHRWWSCVELIGGMECSLYAQNYRKEACFSGDWTNCEYDPRNHTKGVQFVLYLANFDNSWMPCACDD
ncbi:uncharacterized protein K489DRAFT_184028 [Dissoconium aciculare CBS 342.82]|jgi:hypothetical protein|uniref:Uncharacterized protein n=1 Tax=Dissoconium aciculare CBS 342.82 TaxID=1314786 RepID=A0A6J3M8Z3_9PEZI|nr:uncharacterized protein K489DRAFT_184028 [Dissoconium aciculare CBS 342.82]KAF1824516.1 hypothetical protein K489DRAFT_184028 [Dissoconium aciculare CBS 342.82]